MPRTPAADTVHPEAPGCRLRLAAAPAVEVAQRTVPLQPVDAALLAWLALRGATPRGRLAELLWPGSEPDAARGALRQRLYKLRQTLGLELVAGTQTLALAPGIDHDLASGDGLLDDVPLAIGGEFGNWLASERERRRSGRRGERQRAIEAAEREGDYAQALELALAGLQAEPELEDAHRRVIRLHYLLGDRAAARAAYARCVQMLARTIGVAPAPETEALRRLLDQAAPAAPGAGGARPVASTPGLPASLLRPPRLVGRDAETAAALAAWAQGKVVALVAEAGMGKTRLLQQLAPAAPRAAIYVAARPGDAAVPLATLARLLRAVADARTVRAEAPPAALPPSLPPALRHELARVLPEWHDGAATGPLGERLQLQRAVQALLAAQPELAQISVDDLHFADSATLQLLQGLLDEAGADAGSAAPAPRWALGYRPADAGGALRELHDGLLDTARLQPLALSPLSLQALAELVDSLELPGLDGSTIAPTLLQRTGGNPLFALESLRQGVAELQAGRAAAGPPGSGSANPGRWLARPQSVTRLIERRLAQLSPAAQALARCAAIAGSEFSTALATAVLQTPAIALADAWAELESAGVLRDQAFAHDLVYETTLGSIPAAIARHLHAEVAAWLEHDADSVVAPATLARHWVAAARPDRAAAHLERAAQAAAQAYDVREAARLWSQLAELHQQAGQGEPAFEAAFAAANALRSQTTGAEIEAAIARLDALAHTPLQRAAVSKQQAELCLARGDIAAAAAHTAAGLQALDRAPDTPLAAPRAALLNAHGVLMRRLGRYAEARSTLEQAVALARALPASETAAAGAAGATGPAAAAGGSAAAATDADLPSLLNNLGLVLQEQDEHLEAIALLQEAAERQPDPTTRARVLNNLAISLEERGQVALAYEQRLAAARAVAGSGGLVEASVALSLGSTARSLGRFREAMAHLERAGALSQGTKFHRDEDLQRNWSTLWLALGRVNLAREALDRAEAASTQAADRWIVQLGRARVQLALGQLDSARALVDGVHRAWTEAGYARALRRVLVLRAAVLPPEEALPELRTALALPAVQANAGAGLQLQVRLAQVLLALGDTAPALRAAERAIDWLAVIQPLDITPAEIWLTYARCAEAAGEPERAAGAARSGLEFVERVAREHLDPLYQESWRNANPVHVELARRVAQAMRAYPGDR